MLWYRWSFNILRSTQSGLRSQTLFSNACPWMQRYDFPLKFHWSSFLCVQYSSINSDNDLAPTRRQAIIWNNDALVYWRIHMCVRVCVRDVWILRHLILFLTQNHYKKNGNESRDHFYINLSGRNRAFSYIVNSFLLKCGCSIVNSLRPSDAYMRR